jgi:hypothetical protein
VLLHTYSSPMVSADSCTLRRFEKAVCTAEPASLLATLKLGIPFSSMFLKKTAVGHFPQSELSIILVV